MKRKATIREGVQTASACPYCGALLEGWVGVSVDENPESTKHPEGPTPTPGSVTLCANCACLLVYADWAARVRKPTEEETQKCKADAELWELIQMMRRSVVERQVSRISRP